MLGGPGTGTSLKMTFRPADGAYCCLADIYMRNIIDLSAADGGSADSRKPSAFIPPAGAVTVLFPHSSHAKFAP